MNTRAVVTVAVGDFFITMQRSLIVKLRVYGHDAALVAFTDELPLNSPPHEEVPFAFKPHAIQAALDCGFTSIMWMDASVVPLRSTAPLWELIEKQGYWFSGNLKGWNCGQWTCDAALPLLGLSRVDAFEIPQMAATAFGLDFTHAIARAFFNEYMRFAKNGAFVGPFGNFLHEASQDERVMGHRHDQTAASVIAHRLGMRSEERRV